MPLGFSKTASDANYGNPFLSRNDDLDHVKLDVSTLSIDMVDANGFLKPGVPLLKTGAAVSGASQVAHGVTVEATRLPGRTNNTGLGADTTDPLIAVTTHALINRDIAEDNLGRAYSTDELAALDAGGFKYTST